MKNFIRLCFSLLFLVQGAFLFAQEADSIFSDVEFLGNANNYTEAVDTLWEVFTDSVDMEVVYGIVEDKPVGGNRTTILNERTYGDKGDFYVSAEMKLQKRPSAVEETAWWEDGRLFFAWQNDTNYARAQFFNTHGPLKDNPIGQGDAIGLSGFYFMVDGKGYGFMHSDDPGDPVEEIPAETCIPFEGDTSFYDWNEVKVMLEDSVLSMLVNGVVYHAIGLDTVTMIEYYSGNTLDTIDTIPSAVLDLLFTPGQIGIGSSNDRVYFDDVMAGYVPVEGVFSNVPFFGDAANYDEAAAWLWDVFSDDGEMVYGIVQDKPAGGNRTTIAQDDMKYGGHDYIVEADMKLQKRPSAGAGSAWWEDGRLFFAWQDENNYARAQFFNTHAAAKDNPIGQTDALGLSGFYFMVDGQGYGYIHSDDPGDPVEEIDPETCIPYDGDTSFYDWNAVQVMMEDSVLSMLVNGEVYHAIGLDTVTMIEYYTGNRLDTIDTIPSAVMDLLFTAGQIGIGSSNDRVYFDNVKASWVEVEGIFSDIEFYGDAANYSEINPWNWGVVEEDDDMRYGIVTEKPAGGNRISLIPGKTFPADYYVNADMKLFKRPSGLPDQAKSEDGGFIIAYEDEDNYVHVYYTVQHSPGADPPLGASATGMAGFWFFIDGHGYKVTKRDDPGDPIEEIPPETNLPYTDDTSFDLWNNIGLERVGTIITMFVNGEEYFAVDFDTVTIAADYPTWSCVGLAPMPQKGLDMVLGTAKLGLASGNDKVLWDDVEAGHIEVTGKFSDIEYYGEAENYSEINPWLWDVVEEDGDIRYGVVEDKPAGGNRTSIIYDVEEDGDYFIEADMKLFKRPSGLPDVSKSEDGGFIIAYEDEKNFIQVFFSVEHMPGADPPLGACSTGCSGFWIVIDGALYKVAKRDDPGDPLEEIPGERCIPWENDASFDEWNNIRVEREGTIIRMLVNDEEYFAADFDTVTVAAFYPTWSSTGIFPLPQKGIDMATGTAVFGLITGNDKVLWDNVNVGDLAVGIDDVKRSKAFNVHIYPNPATGQFTVSMIDHVRKIEMYNLSGQRVMELKTHGEHSIRINSGQFESGMYFMRFLSNDGNVATEKIMIE